MAVSTDSTNAPVHRPENSPKTRRFNHAAIMRAAHWNARWTWTSGTKAGRRPYAELLRDALSAEWRNVKRLREIALRAKQNADERAAAGLPPIQRKPMLRTRHTGRLAASFAN